MSGILIPFARIVRFLLAASVLAALALGVFAAESPPADRGAAPAKERRLALVIGNGDYPNAPLRNPVNDARDFAAALTDSGFDVIRLENANLRQLRTALRDFGDRLKKQGGVGLFYFAGHGMQLKGRNYLIPVGAQIEREDEIEFESLDANLVLEKLDAAGNRFNIVILDACRNNPFARAFRSTAQGLAQMDAPSGTVIAFATAPGSVASDGPDRNGLYTQYLVESMQRPGLKIEEVFKQVRAAVRRDSGGQQTPWESTSLEGDFYFHPVDLAAAEAARKQQEQARLEELVRVAIAREREQMRKELEEARIQAGNAQQTAVAGERPIARPAETPKLALPESSRPAASGDVATIPTTPGPAVVAGATPGLAASGQPSAPVRPGVAAAPSGNVIGNRFEGKIPAPRFVVGDEWEVLSVTSAATPGSEPVSTINWTRVIGVFEDRLRLTHTRLDRPGGKPIEPEGQFAVSPRLETLFDGHDAFSGHRKFLSFPLEVGDTWSYSYEYSTADGKGRFREDLECTVVGWSQITVPAGTYWALRIDEKGWSNNLSPNAPAFARVAARLDRTLWYSPEIKYLVKSEWRKSNPGTVAGGGAYATHQLIRFTAGAVKTPAAMTTTK
jgi:uncharacterized caspase-like protein